MPDLAPRVASGGAPAAPRAEVSSQPLDPGATILALMATGLGRWDAAVTLREAGGEPAGASWLAGVPPDLVCPYASIDAAIAAFAQRGRTDRYGAQAALTAFLDGRHVPETLDLNDHDWITSLPATLEVDDSLYLSHCRSLQTLPIGLKTNGWVFLDHSGITALPAGFRAGRGLSLDATPLKSLPIGLDVGGTLNLRHTPHWDGQIPADARVGVLVRSDKVERGLPLSLWRQRFPNGERS